ncbi:MAG: DsrE family protein [Sphingomonadaceae bacterium]
MDETPPDLVIIVLTGAENPKRIPSAFFLAATAAAEDMDVVMFFTGPATELLATGRAEQIVPMRGGKSIAEFMKLATGNGVKIIGCMQSLELNGLVREDIPAEIPVITPAAALPALTQAGKVLTW